VLLQHGTADPTVLYTGGLSPDTAALLGLPAAGPSVPELAAAWATRNGCGADRPIESTEGAVTWISHPCDVELRRIEDGGHQWPDEAQDVIWRFFEAHAR
jgi:polyhydroxybutyrate depolymerase